MFDFKTEMLLGEYFLFDYTLGGFIDLKRIFFRLSEIFLIPEKTAKAVYALIDSKNVKAVASEKDYFRYRRVMQYTDMRGDAASSDDGEAAAITVKGNVIAAAAECGFQHWSFLTEAAAYKALADAATSGVLTALRLLGALQCEGVFVGKNPSEGLKNLERAARWNSVEGILYCLYYNQIDRERCTGRLYAVTEGTPSAALAAEAQKKYGVICAEDQPECKLIDKAFGSGVLQRAIYAPQYARIIFSGILNYKDRQKLVFCGSKEILAETSDLPLKLSSESADFDKDAFYNNLPLKREGELTKIVRAAQNADLCAKSVYRPLCISGDSAFVLNMYRSALGRSFCGAHVEKIDASDLSEYDLEPTKSNVFIRSCNEDRVNVYIITLRGEVKESVFSAVKSFLNSFSRRKFRLVHPGVTVDLGAVLPVCVCDGEHARKLKDLCDVISVSPVSDAEKSAAVEHILALKREFYGVKGILLDVKSMEKLTSLSVDTAEVLIDKAVRANRVKGQTISLSFETMREYFSTGGAVNNYGFGGALNES